MENRNQLVLKALKAAEQLRKKLNINSLSIIDPVDIALKMGCSVRYENIESLEGMYAKEPSPTIIIGSYRPNGRKVFTCAHELGHHYFNHGTKIDQLTTQNVSGFDSDEFLVDCFAGFLLMPKRIVMNMLSKQNINIKHVTAMEIFKLSSIFGVGYGTILNHLTYSLKMITKEQLRNLKKFTPKDIKRQLGVDTSNDLIIVDNNWPNKPVDLQVDDYIACPKSFKIDNHFLEISYEAKSAEFSFYKAKNVGYSRILNNNWAANIRISRREYSGLARYRFLSEED